MSREPEDEPDEKRATTPSPQTGAGAPSPRTPPARAKATVVDKPGTPPKHFEETPYKGDIPPTPAPVLRDEQDLRDEIQSKLDILGPDEIKWYDDIDDYMNHWDQDGDPEQQMAHINRDIRYDVTEKLKRLFTEAIDKATPELYKKHAFWI